MEQYYLSAKIRKAANQNITERDYWHHTLAGDIVKSSFPSDIQLSDSFREEQAVFQLSEGIFTALSQRCRENLYSLQIYLTAAVMALLSRTTGLEDIMIGTPVYKQDNTTDLLNRLLPLRNQITAGLTFKQLLIEVKEIIATGIKNQNYPIELMVEQLNLPAHTTTDFPLFDVSVCMTGIHDPVYLEGIKQQIIFTFTLHSDSLEAEVRYNANRYSAEIIAQLITHFQQWLTSALHDLDGTLATIELLTPTEIKHILYELNDTHTAYPTEKTIRQLFTEQVLRTPDHIALIGEKNKRNQLTYSELNIKSNQIAHVLNQQGVQPDTIVAIILNRSINMLIGILGILKAGGAYLPIDPDYPEDRKQFMLSDSAAKIIVTQQFIQEATPIFPRIPITPITPTNLAYIIYTSGTTGKPKGVLIEHRHVVRLLFNDRFQFDFNPTDVWTLFHSYCFDFSVWEMYGALLYGGKLVIIPTMTARDPQVFLHVLKEQQVTVLNQTPSAFYRLMQQEFLVPQHHLNLKYVIFGGEALAPGQLRLWREKYPDTQLINMYGITETTVHVTYKEIGIEEIRANISNIGTPIPTLTCYVMDPGLKLVPHHVAGELCVGGEGVSRGYLNRPELSAMKFVPNPYQPDERLYRSGDRARFTANGEMEYLGRIDHQVKIRGFRIEPAEIEKELLGHPGIKEAAVIDCLLEESAGHERYLCAYFVPLQSFLNPLNGEALREFLRHKLPDYMIPTYFMELESIPLTANGKVNRHVLPQVRVVAGNDYEAPRGETAQILANTWQEVLHLEQIGANDNFFAVGGDSIKAIKLIGAINTTLGVQLKIIDIYSYQTIATMAEYLEQSIVVVDPYEADAILAVAQFREEMMAHPSIRATHTVEDVYPMSDIEKGMVFHSLKEAEEGVYHDQITVQQSYRDFKPERFKKAIALLIEKHPILRTAYLMEESAHVIYKYHNCLLQSVVYHDISTQPPVTQENTVKNYIAASRQRGFDMGQPPLWRIGIFKGSGDIVILVWESHHAIIDGWSNASFLTELNNTYLQLESAPAFIPAALKVGYKEFITRQWAEKRNPAVKAYWVERLTDYKRLKFPDTSGSGLYKSYTFDLGRHFREQLETCAEQSHTNLKHLCFGAFLYMLNMFSYHADITAGLVTHNRPEAEDGDKILGCFLNTLPFRQIIPAAITWADYIEMVDKELVRLKGFEKLSLLEIVKLVDEPVENGNPFFDVVFNLVDFFVYGDLTDATEFDEKNKLDLVSFARTNFLIEVNIVTFRGELFFTIHFSTGFITEQDANRMGIYFKEVLDKFIHYPDGIIAKSDILPVAEKRRLLYELNNTQNETPTAQTISELFNQQAQRTPDNLALLGPTLHITPWDEAHTVCLTYACLQQHAEHLAQVLQAKGVHPGMVVAIWVERSVEMIVGTLAILIAGGAYLPIETELPPERVDYMIKDSGATVLLRAHPVTSYQCTIPTLVLDYTEWNFPVPTDAHLPLVNFNADVPAYVIYTSGSTGQPKGVLVEHRNAVNILLYRQATYPINTDVTSLLLFSYSFDGFVTDCFTPLISGARVVLLGRQGRKDPNIIKSAIAGNKITHIFCTPPLFQAVIEALTVAEASSLQVVTLGGDRLPETLLEAIKQKNSTLELVHEYGVTEAAVTSTLYHHQEKDCQIKIGAPVWNTTILIVDSHGELLPMGIAGEMLIGGAGVAPGYLNRPELTHTFFQSLSVSSTSATSSTIFYHTGDLARWCADGYIEFLGRIDFQVKIRGFRIELGEIESRLQKFPGILRAAVLARPDHKGNNYLCAYIVTDSQLAEIGDTRLQEHLSRDLPDYMIPAYFIKLAQLPITSTGKIDTKSLPEPDMTQDHHYTAPQNDVEKRMVEVWQELLGMEQVGITHNFFQIGGDSIKAMQMVSRLKKYGLAVKINDLFARPTIEKLAGCTYTVSRQIPQDVVYGEVPLTPIQHWFFANHLAAGHHFNQAVMLFRTDHFETDVLHQVFTKLVAHHDVLRMKYQINNGPEHRVRQQNRGLEGKLFDLEVLDFTGDNSSEEELAAKIQTHASRMQGSINLGNGPLLKLGLFKTGQGDHLLIAIHHLVVDGVSWRILLEDIHTGFEQVETGKPITLPEKTDSFKYWSELLTEYAQNHSLSKGFAWVNKPITFPLLPRERQISTAQKILKYADAVTMELSHEDTQNLLKQVHQAYNTEINDILLTALGVAIQEWAHINDVLITLEGHGREAIIDGVDIGRTVGWFTSQFPVWLNLNRCEDISYAIKQVKETLRSIPHKGIGFGIAKYLAPQRDMENPLFQLEPEIGFNYLGQFDAPGGPADNATEGMNTPLMQFSSLTSGESISREFKQLHTLSFTGMIVAGKLSLSLTYNREEYDKTSIRSLMNGYESQLLRIIGHCLQKQVRELTPSDVLDVSNTNLSLEEFVGLEDHIAAHITEKPAIQSIYPLSPMQKGILFFWLTRTEYDIYFIQNLFHVEGVMDTFILERSFNLLIERYDIFRTIFIHQGVEEPLQVVLSQRNVPLYYEDLGHLPAVEQEQVLEEWCQREKERGFDLCTDVMMRLSLFRTGANDYRLGWGFHHILMDGWCMGIIYNELLDIYQSLSAHTPLQLNDVTPYQRYIEWWQKQDKAAGLAYWKNYLSGYENQAGLPPSKTATGYELAENKFALNPEITAKLTALASTLSVTVSTLFQTLWGILLQKYNNNDDVVFGVIVAGRPPELPGVEHMVGLFINTIPVRIKSLPEETFSHLAHLVQQESTTSKSYEYLPLADIQSSTLLKSKLIEHILVFENYPLHQQVKNAQQDEHFATKNWQVTDIKVLEQTNYDFYITVLPSDTITVKLNFNALVYEATFINRLAGHIREIVQQLINHPHMAIKDINMTPQIEKEWLISHLNHTAVAYPVEKTIHHLFAEQVQRTPDHIALTGEKNGGCQLTYTELNNTSTQIANRLIQQGVLPDTIVAIMIDRSIAMISGILGILKAGAAYLPIDPDYPEDRQHFMLADSAATIIVTPQFIQDSTPIIPSIPITPRIPTTPITPTHLAYVIYTSGTTGKPKGTLIEHRHVVRLLFNEQFQFDFNPTDIWTLFHSYCFDFSVWEMYGALLYGGKLVMVSKATARDPWEFLSLLKQQQVTVLNQTPAAFYNLMNQELQATNRYLNSRFVIFGGEALNPAQLKPWQQMYPGCRLINMYGITETTVHVTFKEISRQETTSDTSNIGQPIPTLCLYVVDRQLKLMPVGAAGELCVGGIGVARGYLNRPQLTSEKFVPDPYLAGNVLYRSGDLARLLESGDIQYLGRVDQQVKIRGFRIEPGEIENRLFQIPGIKNAAVLARQDERGDKYLCAYIVFQADIAPMALNIRESLAKDLPEYMIPAYFIPMSHIPLTPNGKIDRHALPEPEITAAQNYVAPVQEVEKRLTEIWQEVLGVQQVGIMDNFFQLGGDSIKAILVASRLKKYGWDVKINDLFAHPVIAQLASCVIPITRQIPQESVSGMVPLTPIQHWFFQSYTTHRDHFNQAVMLYREQGIAEESLKQVFTHLVKHHDALRIIFPTHSQAGITQQNRETTGPLFDLDVYDFRAVTDVAEEIEGIVRRIQASMDITHGPLVKLGLFKTTSGDHLLIAIHHLVIDGVSWRILLEDLQTGYMQVQTGQPITLPDKTDSFLYWSHQLTQYAQHQPFFHAPDTPMPLLPRDHIISSDKRKLKYTQTISIQFSETDSLNLLKKVNHAFNTEINDILLTALGLSLREWANIQQTAIVLEGHGREAIIQGVDIGRTVGWFTSLFPVILDMSRYDLLTESTGLAYAIKSVKETLRRIPHKGITHGIAKYLAPKKENAQASEHNEPEIMFNYLGQFSTPATTSQDDILQFQFSPLAASGSASPELEQLYTLTINGMMMTNLLSLSFVYNQFEYDEQTIRSLANRYQTHLSRLIAFCCQQQEPELTPSDVMDATYTTLSLEEFAGILHHINTNLAEKPTMAAIYPLNPMQKGIFYHWLTRSHYDMYFIQSVFTLTGSINKSLLESSFNTLIERYDIFRTIFMHRGLEEPLQVVLKHRYVEVDYQDITHLSAMEQEQLIDQWCHTQKERGFELDTEVMMRLTLFKTQDQQFQLGWGFHHILMDGWCLAIIYKELLEIYQALSAGQTCPLPQAVPYRRYIQWWLKQDKLAGLTFWEQYLAGYSQPASLPRLSSTPSQTNSAYQLALHPFTISPADSAAIATFASHHHVTVNTLFQALWGVLLQKYNNSHDVVFGTVVSGRPPELVGVEQMVGLFINTVPVRVRCAPDQNFPRLLQRLHQDNTQAKLFEYASLADIQAKSEIRGTLFDHILIFENFPISQQVKHATGTAPSFALDWQVQEIKLVEQTNYDFNIIVIPSASIVVRLSYNALVYDEAMVIRIAGHFLEILGHVLREPRLPLAEISILTAAEKQQLLFDFNQTTTAYPKDKCLHELFAQQVSRTPDRLALFGPINGDCQLTYSELNKQSTQVAQVLIQQGVLPNTIVAIMLERSSEMIIGILGILKSGAAYLPIDPDYPEERKHYMLSDSAAKLLITKQFIQNATSPSPLTPITPVIPIIPITPITPTHLAYIIYTSGSTGRPKGVLTCHYHVSRVVKHTNYIDITPSDRILQLSNYAFDGSVFDIFGALLNGAALVTLSRQDVLSPDRISTIIQKKGITVFFITTALFNTLVDLKIACFDGIRKVLFGGERVSLEHSQRALDYLGKDRIIHVYGPTETTVYATYYFINAIAPHANTIPIGKPISNTTLYILDHVLQPVPIGISGEVYIGGDGVARGYLNNPQLTHDIFISSATHLTLSGLPIRLYKTGDLARWLPDGYIEFLGRIDTQVKIRGFRIELGEIESCLLKHRQIRSVVVVAREDHGGDKTLVAYFVADSDLSPSQLRDYLSATLPEYMIPAHFVRIESIPLSSTGKVDKKALPEPKLDRPSATYVPPSLEIEIKLVEIWSSLLGIDKENISIHDNFFHLGGHSLKATAMIMKIYKWLQVSLPYAEVFKSPTIHQLAKYIIGIKNGPNTVPYAHIPAVEKKEYYPLSSAEKRLVVLQQMDHNAITYNMPMILPLDDLIDNHHSLQAKLQQTLNKLITRHENLRTSFQWVQDEPVQRVHDHVELIFQSLDLETQPQDITRVIKDFIRPFDLSQAPLMRSMLIRQPGDHYTWLVDIHHIISDAVSQQILRDDFNALYNGLELAPLLIHYKDFSQWQNNLIASGAMAGQERYWLKTLEGELPCVLLPTDYSRPPVFTFSGAQYRFTLELSDAQKFQALASQHGGTLYMNMLAALTTLFYKYTGQTDIIIGSGINGRPHAHLQQIIGMFVNMLVMRNTPHGEKTYATFFTEVIANATAAFANQEVQFEELVHQLHLERDPSRNPLFDISMVVQDVQSTPQNITQHTPDQTLPATIYRQTTAKFDLTFFINPLANDNSIHIDIEYYTGIFKEDTIQRLATHFMNVIHAVVTQPSIQIKDIELYSTAEKQQLLYEFNHTDANYPRQKTIPQLFAEQVERTPHHIAVRLFTQPTAPDQNIFTYHTLNQAANRLASFLVTQKGIKPEDPVAIFLSQPLLRAVAILGILKSGAAYVPIDPALPPQRIQYMLADAAIAVLLSETKYQDHLTQLQPENNPFSPVYLDEYALTPTVAENQPIQMNLSAHNLAYIIYTSGTTGRPKGVQVEHSGVVNMLSYRTQEYAMNTGDVALQLFSYGFDGFVTGFFTPICSGAALVLLQDDQLGDTATICEAIVTHHITHFICVPALYAALLDILPGHDVSSLKAVTLAGDHTPSLLIERTVAWNNALEIVNEYGVTECSVLSTLYRHQEQNKQSTIGSPIANTRILILDPHQQLLPIGVYGQLCISGSGLARGYLNNPELTHAKFYSESTKIYQTGDLARWLPDGNIQFLGRLDTQVKIRGFRIELGEIENQLLLHPKIKDVFLCAREKSNNDIYLCAYIVLKAHEKTPSHSLELKTYLSGRLPDYMIPAYFVELEKIPLSTNGKVNRQVLPEPEFNQSPVHYMPPSNETEKKLTRIWSEVLAVAEEKISIHANFFELGGHSLKAATLTLKIHKEFNTKVPLEEVFKRATIRELARYIHALEKELYMAIEPAEKKFFYPLSPAQKRLYILQQMDSQNTTYNMPTIIPLQAEPNIQKLEDTFKQLLKRHESLRTSFHSRAEEPIQRVHDHVPFHIKTISLTGVAGELEKFILPFDLSLPPLLRVSLTKSLAGQFILIVDMHHIISDGISHQILTRDFTALYSGQALPPLRIQYKDYCQWLNNAENKQSLKQQEDYWLNVFATEPTPLNLPLDYPRPPLLSFAGDIFPFQLESMETATLKAYAQKTETTLYMVLLAVFTIFLAKISGGQEDIVVGTGIAGRRHTDLQDIIGMFINTLALRNHPVGEKTFHQFLKEVKATTMPAFENQEYPFELLVEKIVLHRDWSRRPLVEAVLVLQNMEFGTMSPQDEETPPEEANKENIRHSAKFELSLYGIETHNTLRFNFEYCTALFKKETINRFVHYFKDIIVAVTATPDIKIKDIPISYKYIDAQFKVSGDELEGFGF